MKCIELKIFCCIVVPVMLGFDTDCLTNIIVLYQYSMIIEYSCVCR